jgi:lambda family phage portal protein
MKRTILDRAIGYFSPRAEVRRLQARRYVEAMAAREYAGASHGRRFGEWITGGKDSDAEAKTAAPTMRDRARSLVRDNPYASAAVEEWEQNAAPIAVRSQVAGVAPEAARPINDRIDSLWYEWSRRADFNGVTDFNGLQNIIVRAVRQDGGVLVRRRPVPANAGMAIPFQLQLLEMDYLDTSRDRTKPEGGYINGGMEFDSDGRRIGFWLYKQHPGASVPYGRNDRPESVFVSADEILHVFDPLRPGSHIGVTSFSTVIQKARDIDGYEEAELVRKQTEACLTAIVEDMAPVEDTETLGAPLKDSEGNVVESFNPGMIAYTSPGRQVRFNQPAPAPGTVDYLASQHRGMAAGLRVPYELMTGDLSRVSFISGRMGLISFRRGVRKFQNKVMIPQLLDRVWDWFIAYGQAAGVIPNMRVWARYTPPRWESIQPAEDAKADLMDIRSGARTLPQVIAERGGDFADQIGEIAEANKMLDELEVILDSDPRQRTANGMPADQPTEQPVNPPESPSSDSGARIVDLGSRR